MMRWGADADVIDCHLAPKMGGFGVSWRVSRRCSRRCAALLAATSHHANAREYRRPPIRLDSTYRLPNYDDSESRKRPTGAYMIARCARVILRIVFDLISCRSMLHSRVYRRRLRAASAAHARRSRYDRLTQWLDGRLFILLDVAADGSASGGSARARPDDRRAVAPRGG